MAKFEDKYTPAQNYRRLMAIYRQALQAGPALSAVAGRAKAAAGITT
jgi:hypothetical protein